jgi:hypothetical protein
MAATTAPTGATFGAARDREADGRDVYADYILDAAAPITLSDANGSARSWACDDWMATPHWMYLYRVREKSVACSGAGLQENIPTIVYPARAPPTVSLGRAGTNARASTSQKGSVGHP